MKKTVRPNLLAIPADVDTSQMTHEALYQHFKNTNPGIVLRRYLAREIDPLWRPQFEALAVLKGSAFFKAYFNLKDAYACWRNRPADVEAYEARFWATRRFIARRRNAAAWHSACASVISVVLKQAQGCRHVTPCEDIAADVAQLVRHGRQLFGDVPALDTTHRHVKATVAA